ncbi:MAG: sulfurtransferase [Candidatus Eremiobacteraeota bacterium]|nr:sulfurtransferase [Candidatus Eremiobacteraeota bacterium]
MDTFVDDDWLAQRLDDATIAIVDTRSAPQAIFYGGVGREHYVYGHIPRAVHLDYADQLQDPYTSYATRVAPPQRFMEEMAKAGISDDNTVIAYDDGEVPYAARLVWMLHYYGHDAAAILAGGLPAWLEAGHPRVNEIPSGPMKRFTPKPQPQLRAELDEVLAVAEGRSDAQLLAAWPEVTYARREREIAGARRLSFSQLFDETQYCRMVPLERLRQLTANLDPQKRTITYCGNGVHSAAAYFALRAAGFTDVAVYDGSWAEWGHLNLPSVPRNEVHAA